MKGMEVREKMGGQKPSSQSNNVHEWTVTDRALFMAHLDCRSIYYFSSSSKHSQRHQSLF